MKFSYQIILNTVFLLLVHMCFSQTHEENYVQETTYSVPTQTGIAVDDDDKIIGITYMNGLAAPKQTISVGAGGDREDLVIPIVYDNFGRLVKDYLPLPVASNGAEYYSGALIPNSETYYVNKFNDDFDQPLMLINNHYSEKRYESFTSGYVEEQAAPGHDWVLNANSNNDHTVKFAKATNNTFEVRSFHVSFTGNNKSNPVLTIIGSGYYGDKELFKSVIKDENWQENQQFIKNHTAEEFTDKLGRVVLKRNYNQTVNNVIEPHDTYYVYDDFGNLTYVIPPMLSKQIINTSNNQLVGNYQALLDELGFQYIYDNRNRLVEKKLPGKGWEYIVYNLLNRPVLTQDANLRLESKWLLTKYDVFGRVAYAGITYSPNQTRESLQITANNTAAYPYQYVRQLENSIDIAGTQVYYSNDTFPINSITKILSIQYYDEYIDHQGITIPNYVFGVNRSDQLNGLPTVSKTRILNTEQWITGASVYDKKNRLIWEQFNNDYFETEDMASFKLNFLGDITESLKTHNLLNNPTIKVRDYYEFDHRQRLTTHKQKIDNEPVQLISQNLYDELGMVVQKNVGGETFLDGYTYLTNVEIDVDDVISKSDNNSSNNGWNAGLLTRGKIINDGGIKFEVPESAHRYYKIGLTENTGFTDISGDWDEFDYGIYILAGDDNYGDARSDIKLIIDGVTTGPIASYVAGDEFSIERIDDQIIFKKGSTILNQVTQTNSFDLTGKVGLYSFNAKVKAVTLFGQQIDTKLQEINYTYNVRGWLTNINNIEEILDGKASDDLFDFRINYNEIATSTTGNKLYNGNIAQTAWRTRHDNLDIRAYEYSYDALNRITNAKSLKSSAISSLSYNDNHNVENISYDQNGNIQALTRNGFNNDGNLTGVWDDLQYSYTGNQLQEIIDMTNSSLSNYGFIDGATNSNEYRYDVNGNLIADDNKGITLIEYNHLNRPLKITFSTLGSVEYLYDAYGNKLEKKVTTANNNAITKYSHGFVYLNNSLNFIAQSEGYIKPTISGGIPTPDSVMKYDKGDQTITYSAFKYVFHHKDHLGNIRLSYSDKDLNGAIDPSSEVLAEDNYYPFGVRQKGYNNVIDPNANSSALKYKFNGKEIQDEFELNSYDFGARFYDPATGRWFTPDALAEKYFSEGVYNYTMNNPIIFIDPDGNQVAMCCQGLIDTLDGVWTTVKGEVVGTYDFLTVDAWERDTWKGLGNVALGTFVAGATSSPGGPVNVPALYATDIRMGTNTMGAMDAMSSSLNDFGDDLVNGNTKEKAAAITSLFLIFSPGKLDDLGKLSKLTKYSNAIQAAGRSINFQIVDGAIDLGKNHSSGWYDFVITDKGDLRLGSGHHKLANDGSDNLIGAGEVFIDENGKINTVTNNSGHYQPTRDQGIQSARILKESGITTDDLQFVNYN